ncbi:MAG TPA: aminoacyl-tRNA hydrolase [Acidobacteriota bacterium]
MRALAGLGNPGDRYAEHRHNAGWMLLSVLERRHPKVESRELQRVSLSRIRMKGRRADGGPAELWLMRSKTYMNESGLAVAKGCDELGLTPGQIVVAFDDVDLPLGKIRLRAAGGSGGQKGMQSVIDALGSEQIPRLRLGIRGERVPEDTAEYVLHRFERSERDIAAEMIEEAADAVETVLRSGLTAAMNRFN